jgi:hypothetical protein
LIGLKVVGLNKSIHLSPIKQSQRNEISNSSVLNAVKRRGPYQPRKTPVAPGVAHSDGVKSTPN